MLVFSFQTDLTAEQNIRKKGALLKTQWERLKMINRKGNVLFAFYNLSLFSLLSCKPVCQVVFEIYSYLSPHSNCIWIP